jgi:hypothetical protein
VTGAATAHWLLHLHPYADGVPSKVGEFDSSLILDFPCWLGPALALLTKGRPSHASMWRHSPQDYNDFLEAAALRLGIAHMKPSAYGFRHAGASYDVLSARRQLLEIKRRGRWKTDRSLARYGKEALAAAELSKVPPIIREYGALVEQQLYDIMRGMVKPFPPPALPLNKCARRQKR